MWLNQLHYVNDKVYNEQFHDVIYDYDNSKPLQSHGKFGHYVNHMYYVCVYT